VNRSGGRWRRWLRRSGFIPAGAADIRVIYAAAFALTVVALDYLIAGKASRLAESMFGSGGAIRALVVASAAFDISSIRTPARARRTFGASLAFSS